MSLNLILWPGPKGLVGTRPYTPHAPRLTVHEFNADALRSRGFLTEKYFDYGLAHLDCEPLTHLPSPRGAQLKEMPNERRASSQKYVD